MSCTILAALSILILIFRLYKPLSYSQQIKEQKMREENNQAIELILKLREANEERAGPANVRQFVRTLSIIYVK